MDTTDAVRSRDRGRGVVIGMSVFVFTAALLTGVLVSTGNAEALGTEERMVIAVAFAAPMAATAVLALLGWRERPWFFVAAGLALLPMTMLSFSMLLFPLAIPAFAFFIVGVARPRLQVHPRAQPWAALLSYGFLLLAVANFFARRETRVASTGSGLSTHEVFSTWGAVTSIAFVVAAIAVAALAPQDA